MDAMLNFSKCSRVTKVHPADSENRPPGLPKTIKKKLTLTFPGSAKIRHLAPGLRRFLSDVMFQWYAQRHCFTGVASWYVTTLGAVEADPSTARDVVVAMTLRAVTVYCLSVTTRNSACRLQQTSLLVGWCGYWPLGSDHLVWRPFDTIMAATLVWK